MEQLERKGEPLVRLVALDFVAGGTCISRNVTTIPVRPVRRSAHIDWENSVRGHASCSLSVGLE
jgi:hypothetical protein